MNTFKKGSDLLSKRIIAISGLIVALANTGLDPMFVVPVSIAFIFLLRK